MVEKVNENLQNLVDFFGSQGKTGKALGCSQSTVFKWLHQKMNVSPLLALKAEKLTNGQIKAIDLCPRLAELEDLETKTPNQS